jgi:hypothetical protein
MPKAISDHELYRDYLARRDSEISRNRAKRYRDFLSRRRRDYLLNTQSLPGDRTDNTPDLRRNSRQSMRFDRDMPTTTYLVQESGKYWYRDVNMTLAVITHARMMMTSNRKYLHHAE